MNPWLHAIVVVVEIGLAVTAAEYARRSMNHAIEARYEAEFAKRCAARARAAARYCHDAATHLEIHAGVPVTKSLRVAWNEAGIGSGEHGPYGGPVEGGSKTPA